MDYYDIDDILRSEELLPVTLTRGARNMGWLDPNNRTDDPDLQEGAKALLPAWIAEPLALKKYAAIGIPKSHNNAARADLKADPSVFSMKPYPFYYDIGLLLVRTGADKSDLHNVLKQAFRGRFETILDNAQNWRGEDDSSFTEKLTRNEEKIFRVGHRASEDFDRWRRTKEESLEPAPTVTALTSYLNAKKRKRDDSAF